MAKSPTQRANITVVNSEDGSSEPIRVLAEVFGRVDDAAIPVLLLSEAEAPSTRWPERLIDGLLDAGHAVIRFDTRGAGRNADVTTSYSLDDLASDAVAVLDHFEVARARVLGRSMGGMVAQVMALDHPDRVHTLGLLSTSGGPDDELGAPSEWFVDRMSERLFAPPPTDMAERVLWVVDQLEWFAGPRFGFDRDAWEDEIAAEVASSWHEQIGHGRAVVDAPNRYGRLGEIAAVTTVVHGTADPVYPVAHGQCLAEQIPSSSLTLVEGLGHDLPESFVDQLLQILADVLD